jgi:DNA-binding SARP family transcriptional activator
LSSHDDASPSRDANAISSCIGQRKRYNHASVLSPPAAVARVRLALFHFTKSSFILPSWNANAWGEVMEDGTNGSSRVGGGADPFAHRAVHRHGRLQHGARWSGLAQSALLSLRRGEVAATRVLLEQIVALNAPRNRIDVCAHAPDISQNIPPTVRIHTLGRFTLAVEGAPRTQHAKPQRKPLDLLKALIVSGARPAAAAKLADCLWPDGEGDAARNCLRVAVHRLRQLLAHHDAIVFRDDKLFLNPQICWVDAWAFEQACELLGTTSEHAPVQVHGMVQTIAMYGGHLFADEPESWWILAARDRLRGKWLRLVWRLGEHYETTQRWTDACALYSCALIGEPVSEPLYRRLMVCQHAGGLSAEIAVTYALCCTQLLAGPGTLPCRETKSLYRMLCGA